MYLFITLFTSCVHLFAVFVKSQNATALHLAIATRNRDMAALLLEHHADKEAQCVR